MPGSSRTAPNVDFDPPDRYEDVPIYTEPRLYGIKRPGPLRELVTASANASVLYQGNSLTQGFAEVEVFGGAETQAAISNLLTDAPSRAELRAKQQLYVDRLRSLDDGATVLERLMRL